MPNPNPLHHPSFDLPVPGMDARYLRMPVLLRAFRSAVICEPKIAVNMGREMVGRRYIPGQLAYARFLRTTASISMPRSQRHQEAESILLRLDQELELTVPLETAIAMELAELYHPLRPVGELAALLRAHRLGAAIPPDRIQRCRRAVLKNVDVNRLGDHPADAYALAVELDYLGNAPQFTEVFYRIAFDGAGENAILKGKAALGLAGFYGPGDERIAAEYYLSAKNCGLPELAL